MRRVIILWIVLMLAAAGLAAQQRPGRTRLLDELNWIEIRRLVPDSVRTVLLAVGTVEPHGVINNGADLMVPQALAERLAPRVNALVAPPIPYGVTVTLDEYPGTVSVSAATLEAYVRETMSALARRGFRNIVVLNGHGGNSDALQRAAERVFRETDARVLVTDWWTLTADLVQDVWGTAGGHAGNNETAAVLAVRPDLVHPELYAGPEMTTARGTGWTAYPFPSAILLYQEGEGYPDFDAARARRYFDGVADRLERLIRDVIIKWDRAGL